MLPSGSFDPFSFSAIKLIDPFLLPPDTTWDGFEFHKSLESELLQLSERKAEDLPALKANVFQLSLVDVPLPDLSAAPTISTCDSDDDYFLSLDGDADEDGAEDIWNLPDIQKRRQQSQLASWDNFLVTSHEEPASAYLSETQPTVWHDLLVVRDQSPPRHVKPDVLMQAFFELVMGRNSVLFNWEEKNGAFVLQWQNITALGYSTMLVQSCFDEFSNIGTGIRRLMRSTEAFNNAPARIPARNIAFLSASRSILYALNKHLCERSPGILSILQLKGKITKTGMMVHMLNQWHEALEVQQEQPLALRTLLQVATESSLRYPLLGQVVQAIVLRTCGPVLLLLAKQIGLSCAQPMDTQSAEDDIWEHLLGSMCTNAIHEVRQSLRLLKAHASGCSLLTTNAFRTTPLMTLGLGFSFETICELQLRATAYEDAMKSLVVSAESSTSTSALETPASDSFELEKLVDRSMSSFQPFRLDLKLFDTESHVTEEINDGNLQEYIVEYLEDQNSEEADLPLGFEESISLSILPLVTAQHRLLSFSVLRVLFQDQNLLSHLDLQRQVHLLGNGLFSSRLSTALFDSDQTSGEGQRRTGASTGLRLHARDSWPPAGSELRLVLMSILSDSLSAQHRPLEECISFAIRDMSSEDLEKCRNVNSIHALDFLRLQYTAPNEILEAVITPEILDKYDRITQHLLRTMRLQAVMQSMLRDSAGDASDRSHKVVVEMHHFISTMADYCHNIVIENALEKSLRYCYTKLRSISTAKITKRLCVSSRVLITYAFATTRMLDNTPACSRPEAKASSDEADLGRYLRCHP